MAVSLEQFRGRFPEFKLTDTAQVNARLAEAGRMFSSDILGDQYDDAVGYQAAILLHNSIHGIPAARSKAPDVAAGYANSLKTIIGGLGKTHFGMTGVRV